METKQASFEGWAVVELLGHQREIGYVTTEAYGTAVMFRVDTPELSDREFVLTRPEYNGTGLLPAGAMVKREAVPARTRLVAPGSLYAINPCTEEAARTAIEQSTSRQLILIEAPTKVLAAAEQPNLIDPFDDEAADDNDDGLANLRRALTCEDCGCDPFGPHALCDCACHKDE